MSASAPKKGLPVWMLGTGVTVLVLVAGFVAWKAMGGSVDSRTSKSIRPGQYSFQNEIAKMQTRDKAKAEAEKPMGGF